MLLLYVSVVSSAFENKKILTEIITAAQNFSGAFESATTEKNLFEK